MLPVKPNNKPSKPNTRSNHANAVDQPGNRNNQKHGAQQPVKSIVGVGGRVGGVGGGGGPGKSRTKGDVQVGAKKGDRNRSRSRKAGKGGKKLDGSSDTDQGQKSATVNNTDLLYRRANPQDTNPTTKKPTFESKPIIKQLNKRLGSYSKQYTPQYFTSILEYTISKETRNSICPTADKINRWRAYVCRQREIQRSVALELRRVNEYIVTSRKKMREEYRQRYGGARDGSDGQQEDEQFTNIYSFDDRIGINKTKNNPKSDKLIYQQSPQSHQSSPQTNNQSCPQIKFPKQNNQHIKQKQFSKQCAQVQVRRNQNCRLDDGRYVQQQVQQNSQFENQGQVLTDKILGELWNSRYDKFACMIDTIYEMLGDNQCSTTIFPACYLFYTMVVSDIKVFNFLDKSHPISTPTYPISATNSISSHSQSQSQSQSQSLSNIHLNKPKSTPTDISTARSAQPCQMQLIEYYLIISILVATKYHEIYPASLVDLIESVNCSLSYDKAIRYEGQLLEMLSFGEFYNETEVRVLRMFGVVIGWSSNQLNVCEFVLESGLNNPKLYAYSTIYKAAVAIGIYEEQFLKTQEKFMIIKNLCPGLTLELAQLIKKQYRQAVVYNYKNKFTAQKRKFYIFDNQMKTLTKSNLGA